MCKTHANRSHVHNKGKKKKNKENNTQTAQEEFDEKTHEWENPSNGQKRNALNEQANGKEEQNEN